MNKQDLIDHVARESGLTKVQAGRALDSMLSGIGQALARGDRVALVGFGTFEVGTRIASKGRNPRTGKEIDIPATKRPKFRAGTDLRAAVEARTP